MKWQVVVNGRPIQVDSGQLGTVVEVEPGVYSVLLEGASYEIRLTGTAERVTAYVHGIALDVEVQDPRDTSRASRASIGSGRQEISAPMPGKVIRLLVNVGDDVEIGQGLIVVEAMKMQNELKAARPGRVLEVRAHPGATVGAGDTLVVID